MSFIGQINTLSDQFDGEASLEIEWLDSNVIDEYDSKKHWNPKIYIYNALGELKQQITHTIKMTELGETIICEQQKLKGAYYETLELNNVSLHPSLFHAKNKRTILIRKKTTLLFLFSAIGDIKKYNHIRTEFIPFPYSFHLTYKL